jgi:uncharacterized protein (TIGR02996 family)
VYHARVAKFLDALANATNDDDKLRALVAWWRDTPAIELADAIAKLGARLDRARPAIEPKNDKSSRCYNWLDADEKTDDDALTGWLLAQSFLGDSYKFEEPCAKRIGRWKPDPRITDAVVAVLARDDFFSQNAWAPLMRAVAAGRDTRALPALDATDNKHAAKAAAEIRAAFPKGAPKLSERERRALADALGGERDDGALLAAVWAAPADDAPRLVYADSLTELGDPRGEFITLQCKPKLAAADKKRARELQDKHAKKWLGPLEIAILDSRPVSFERGFPAKATICAHWGSSPKDDSSPREKAIRKLMDHPAWSTFREVKMAKLATQKRAPLIAHLEKLGVKVTLG